MSILRNDMISIIIPVFNVENYVGKCIESVLNQTYRNLQIILVDDGSTDSSGQICEEYAKKDSRILCFHKENGGLSDARNFALDKAKGKYISFIDSDDFVSKKYIDILYNNLVESDADISICNFIRINEGDLPTESIGGDRKPRVFDKVESFYALFDNFLGYQFTVACCKLYKACIFDHIRYPKGRNYEDTATAHLIYDKISKVVYEDVNLYYYLVRSSSITKQEQYMKDDAALAVRDRVTFFEHTPYTALLQKSREQYLATLMGMHARMRSSTDDVLVHKKKLYTQVKALYRDYKRNSIRFDIKLRVRFFLLFPKLYSNILKKVK